MESSMGDKNEAISRTLCDRSMPLKLKGKFYRTTIIPALLHGS